MVLSLSAGYCCAQEKTFTLDPARSIVEFTLPATGHTVHGTFKFKSGSIIFDASKGAASGQLVVDATTGESGNDSRDHKMKSEVLETGRYPEIALQVEKLENVAGATGRSAVELHGSMLLHGQAHEINLPLAIEIQGDDARATGELLVPYVDWGLKNPSTFILRVSKQVMVRITVVGRLNSP